MAALAIDVAKAAAGGDSGLETGRIVGALGAHRQVLVEPSDLAVGELTIDIIAEAIKNLLTGEHGSGGENVGGRMTAGRPGRRQAGDC